MTSSACARISAFKTLAATKIAEIRAAGDDSWQNINLSQREERIIHDYFIGQSGAGLKYLNDTISPLFLAAGFEVKFAGIFCHGHPRVTSFQGKTNQRRNQLGSPCELGDLHLVFTFLDQAKALRDQRGILFQAKKAPVTNGSSLIQHPDQSTLYEVADSFDYANMLSGSRNWPTFRDCEKALHYLFCGSFPAQTSSARAPVLINFGELLFRFMSDSEGLYFAEPRAKSYRAWWDVNWDLLKTIAAAYYQQTSRGEGVTDVLSHFNDFSDQNHFFLELGKDGDGGISTMFVIVRDRELLPEQSLNSRA